MPVFSSETSLLFFDFLFLFGFSSSFAEFSTDVELKDAIEEVGKGYQIQRYKGLGEMNPEQLWDTTMNPNTRTLLQVGIDDGTNAEKVIATLMGDNIESRKEYIGKYANFNKDESLFASLKS